MRPLLDPATGELVEVLPEAVLGPAAPYDYADYRRAQMAATREHRAAVRELEERGRAKAAAEAEYRKVLAVNVGRAKAAHGATVAEVMAKGEPEVVDAIDKFRAAETLERAALEFVQLCRADRAALNRMGEWSREADADGWRA